MEVLSTLIDEKVQKQQHESHAPPTTHHPIPTTATTPAVSCARMPACPRARVPLQVASGLSDISSRIEALAAAPPLPPSGMDGSGSGTKRRGSKGLGSRLTASFRGKSSTKGKAAADGADEEVGA